MRPVAVTPPAYRAPQARLCRGRQADMRALRVPVNESFAYWTVIDTDLERVAVADAYLQHLRFARGLAEGTTKSYAEDLALFLDWCDSSGRDLTEAAGDLVLFVAVLRTTAVGRRGSGQDRPRSPARINHVLTVVRELYKHAVATRHLESSVLTYLFEVGDDRNLPAELKPEGGGLRYRAAPRHRLRQPRPGPPRAITQPEAEALIRAASRWRDRFLLVLLWFCGMRIGEALGLRRSDIHLLSSARALGCDITGPHVHVVKRDNPNGAAAKSLTARHVPVRAEVVDCYDRYLVERERCPAARACDFVFVNLAHEPLGHPMRYHTVRQWLTALSGRAGLEAPVAAHMFRHATATELLARGATIDVVKELLGHASILTTQRYSHPGAERMRAAIDHVGPLGYDSPAGSPA